MGSLRNPIGPLPSSIYWRRRTVAASIVVLLALLVVWALNLGGGDSESRSDAGGQDGPNGQGPTDSITPGPTTSKPEVSDRPGGRDEADGGADSGGDGGGGNSGGGSGGGDGGDNGGGEPGGTTGDGALSGSGGSVTGGQAMPAGSGLPVCAPGTVKVTLSSVKNEYGPDDKPEFKLTVKNGGDDDCRINLGRTATVVTVSGAGDDRIWSSGDCPPSRSAAYIQVPADGETVQTLKWDRKPSKPKCAKTAAGSAKPDTYLVEAKVKGLTAARTSFVLAKD